MDSGHCDESHLRHLMFVVGDISDAANERDLTSILLDAGFDALAIETGSATMTLLAGGVNPCVVVIDLDLPDMTGWELRARIHALDRRDRPAAVLASATESAGTPAGVLPIRALLQKPRALVRVIRVLEQHCPRRLASAVA